MNQNENIILEGTERKKGKRKNGQKNENVKKIGFTVFDFFLVIVVILCVLGIGFRTTIAEFFVRAEPTQTVEIGFKTAVIEKGSGQELAVGETLLLDNEEKLGTVSVVTRESNMTAVSTEAEDGSLMWTMVEDPAHDILRGVLLVEGRYGDDGFMTVDHNVLYVGKIINIHTASYSVTVTITEIPRK